jgi:hypothetical protein
MPVAVNVARVGVDASSAAGFGAVVGDVVAMPSLLGGADPLGGLTERNSDMAALLGVRVGENGCAKQYL